MAKSISQNVGLMKKLFSAFYRWICLVSLRIPLSQLLHMYAVGSEDAEATPAVLLFKTILIQ